MKGIHWIFASSILFGLSGCGGGSSSGSGSDTGNVPDPDDSGRSICTASPTEVDWNKLLTENATKLSEYKLFQNQCDPTANPNSRGLAYDLSVPLFTDYASKYRFVFVPENQTATFHASEVFEFPVGSVLTKTFTLPSDTRNRGVENEDIVETRLLIRRERGWVSLPYVWNADKTDAEFDQTGELVPASILHNGETLNFDYGVPNQQACTSCHQFNPNGTNDAYTDGNGNIVDPTPAFFSPIGPKARFLNKDYDYGSGAENQLQKWVSEGLLASIPDAGTIQNTPIFNDDVDLDSISPSQVETNAKAWLDINCAHCHREEGSASNVAFNSAYWSDNFDGDGTCAEAVSGADGSISTIIIPGNAEESLVFHRINTEDAGVSMPPLGREVIHQEGTALVKRWIDNMQPAGCD